MCARKRKDGRSGSRMTRVARQSSKLRRRWGEKAKAIEDALIQKKANNPLQPPIKLNGKLAALAGFVNAADVAPTQQAQEVYKEIAARIDRQLRQFDDAMEADLGAFNRLVRDAGVGAIVPRA